MFGIPLKWIAIAGAVIAAGILIGTILSSFEKLGASKEREAVVNQNKESGNAGENARLNMHECLSRGLRFDYATGKCQS